MTEDEQWILWGLVIAFCALIYKGIYLPNQSYFDSEQWKFDLFLWLLSILTIVFSIWIVFLCVRKVVRYKKAQKEAIETAERQERERLEQEEKDKIKERERKEHEKWYQDFLANYGKQTPRDLPLKEDILITLDREQDVHPAWNKSIIEHQFLKNNEYALCCFHNLENGRQKPYYVKKRHPESAIHTFYVDLIYWEIRKYTKEVEKYRTEKPDIIFTNKVGQEIAIEVETGIGVKSPSKKEYHNEKFARCREKWANRCYIFLIRKDLKNSYKRHKLPILFRLQIKEFVRLQFNRILNSTIVDELDVTNREFASYFRLKENARRRDKRDDGNL